jgi:hypothetical protein
MTTPDLNMRQELLIFMDHLNLQSGIAREAPKVEIDEKAMV